MNTIHLTLTGPLAGQTLCGLSRKEAQDAGHVLNHAQFAPLSRGEYRSACCPGCLLSYAKSYSSDEEKPAWVSEVLAA